MKIKKFSLLLVLLAAVATSAFGDGTPNTIPMPPNLTLTGQAGGVTTNLANGWTNATTITTNIQQSWNGTNAPFGMILTTNYSTNVTVQFADFDAIGQDYVTIQHAFNCSTLNSNEYYQIGRSVDKRIWDTTGNLWRTNTSNGSTNVCDLYQIDMRGYPYGRILSITWSNASASCTWSNGVTSVIGTSTNVVPGFQWWKPNPRTTTSDSN